MNSTRKQTVRVAAVDLGASSGRIVAVSIGADQLTYDEVHRFPNNAVPIRDGLYWDILGIYREVMIGLRSASSRLPLDAIGIDSWAVDFGLLDRLGNLIGNPRSYRDPYSLAGQRRLLEATNPDELYARTGIQQQPFNTACQLLACAETGLLDTADKILLLPDLLAYWMTGQMAAERTNASTTQLYDVSTGSWALTLLDHLSLPSHILPALVDPGFFVGNVSLGISERDVAPANQVPVIAVCSHDTASAVVAVPANGADFAFISSGTWSLVGVEVNTPILTPEARAAGFTNEAGIDGTTRFLTNVMGLWVLSECQRHWKDRRYAALGTELLIDEAICHPPLSCVIDINDPRLLAATTFDTDPMPTRITELAAESGEPIPDTPGEIARCVIDSLALAYRRAVSDVARLTGRSIEVIHIVGGGSRHPELCQLTADSCEIPVLAGPSEATAIGNALVQARALGGGIHDRDSMRSLIRRTHRLMRYQPRSGGSWADAERRVYGR